MNEMRKTISAHFIHAEDGILFKRNIEFAPSVGDELRFNGDKFFKVLRLVWIYDEPKAIYARLNIQIEEA